MARIDKIVIEPELLESLYWGNGYPLFQIGNIFGCCDWTILRRLKEYNIPVRDHKLSDFVFNARQKQIFEGCMLGDSSLTWSVNNCYFVNADKHKDYIIWLQNQLGLKDISGISPVYYFKGAGAPCAYQLRTKVIPSISDEYKRWYPNGKGIMSSRQYKVIPEDIDLTLTKVLFWYIGDGCYVKNEDIAVFTNCLSLKDAEMLKDKLCVLFNVDTGVTINKHGKNSKGSQVYRIRLNKLVTSKFFNLVVSLGFDIPECYQYKFGR